MEQNLTKNATKGPILKVCQDDVCSRDCNPMGFWGNPELFRPQPLSPCRMNTNRLKSKHQSWMQIQRNADKKGPPSRRMGRYRLEMHNARALSRR